MRNHKADDESLFFAPTILNLLHHDTRDAGSATRSKKEGHVLSLSTGKSSFPLPTRLAGRF